MPTLLGNADAFDLADQTAYVKYKADTAHSYDPGVLVLPVASEAAMSVHVRIHGGQGRRTVTYDIRKQGNPPVAPSPSLVIGDEYLTGATVTVPTAVPNPQTGGYDWTLQGEYTYVDTGRGRLPGRDLLPAVGYPFLNPAQDTIAVQSLNGGTVAQLESELKSTGVLSTGGMVWPLTVYPSNLMMNPLTIGI